MSQIGSVPIQTLRFNNHTVAASLNGTAAATVLGTVTCAYARAWEVFNLTLNNLEIYLKATAPDTAPGIFVPGTAASSIAHGMSVRAPCAIQSGYIVFARTTQNVPVTISTTSPLYINLWA